MTIDKAIETLQKMSDEGNGGDAISLSFLTDEDIDGGLTRAARELSEGRPGLPRIDEETLEQARKRAGHTRSEMMSEIADHMQEAVDVDYTEPLMWGMADYLNGH